MITYWTNNSDPTGKTVPYLLELGHYISPLWILTRNFFKYFYFLKGFYIVVSNQCNHSYHPNFKIVKVYWIRFQKGKSGTFRLQSLKWVGLNSYFVVGTVKHQYILFHLTIYLKIPLWRSHYYPPFYRGETKAQS